MKFYLSYVETVKNSLREDFLYLTEVLLKKTIPHANKQLQDTLTKYFLENYVSDLLKEKMRKNSNRAVFQEIQATISSGRPKYLKLLNAFEDKIRFFQLDAQYNSMLLTLILDSGRHQKNSEEWRTHTRKRMLSLLLYVHWNEQEKRDEFQSFYDMWRVAFPDNPLPQRQFKNHKIHTFDQKSMKSSQSLDSESLYNQQRNNKRKTNNDTGNELGEEEEKAQDLNSNYNEEVAHKYPLKKLKLLDSSHNQQKHQNLGNKDSLLGSNNVEFHGTLFKQQVVPHLASVQPESAMNNENFAFLHTKSNLSLNSTKIQGVNFGQPNPLFGEAVANNSHYNGNNTDNNMQNNNQHSRNNLSNISYQQNKQDTHNQLSSMNFEDANNFGPSNSIVFQNNQNFEPFSNPNNSNYLTGNSNSKLTGQQSAARSFPPGFFGSYCESNPNGNNSIFPMNIAQSFTNQYGQIPPAAPSSLLPKGFSSDSLNFATLQPERLLENKFSMDASSHINKNNTLSDIFLTSSQYNPSQFSTVANNAAIATAAGSLNNLPSAVNRFNQQKTTQDKNSSHYLPNLKNSQLPSHQALSSEGSANILTYHHHHHDQSHNDNHQNGFFNSSINFIQNETTNFQQNKLEQSQIKQQQSSQQYQYGLISSSFSNRQQKLLQPQSVANEYLPMLYQNNFSMGSSGSNNLGHFPQPYSNTSNNNHHSLYFTGSTTPLGMGRSGPNNYMHQFFLQYYSEFKEEQFNWESTQPLSMYGKQPVGQGNRFADLIRRVKKNIIVNGKNQEVPAASREPKLQDKQKNNKNNVNEEEDDDDDNDSQFSGTVESYEVQENPVSH